MRREAFKFWDLVRLILETLRYMKSLIVNETWKTCLIPYSSLCLLMACHLMVQGHMHALLWTNHECCRQHMIAMRKVNLCVLNSFRITCFCIKIRQISYKKINFKMLYAKWWPFCPGLNVFSLLTYFQHAASLTQSEASAKCVMNFQLPSKVNKVRSSMRSLSSLIDSLAPGKFEWNLRYRT